MKITDALYGEHGPLYALLRHCEESALQWEHADLILGARCLEAALLSHAEVEDALLFAALEARMPPHGPIEVMRAEHEEIDRALAALRTSDDEESARRHLLHAVVTARDHFAKEEQVLFPLAEQFLGVEELSRLGAIWAERRGVAVESASPCVGARS
jgi:iron-sulfur cluster repair protein YtfE (RIC family)